MGRLGRAGWYGSAGRGSKDGGSDLLSVVTKQSAIRVFAVRVEHLLLTSEISQSHQSHHTAILVSLATCALTFAGDVSHKCAPFSQGS